MFFSGTSISCTHYITDRNEVSKWSIQMLGNIRFTVVRCLSCTEWGGSPVESKCAVVQVKAIKLGSIWRGRTEPIQVGSSLVFLHLKAWFSLILILILFLGNLLLSILTKKKDEVKNVLFCKLLVNRCPIFRHIYRSWAFNMQWRYLPD